MPKTIKKITTFKRHLISFSRVFLATMLGTIALQLQAMPTTGFKEFAVSLFISSLVAGIGAVLKVVQEKYFLTAGE